MRCNVTVTDAESDSRCVCNALAHKKIVAEQQAEKKQKPNFSDLVRPNYKFANFVYQHIRHNLTRFWLNCTASDRNNPTWTTECNKSG